MQNSRFLIRAEAELGATYVASFVDVALLLIVHN